MGTASAVPIVVLEGIQTYNACSQPKRYSYRNASIGSKFAAFHAG
jgi:hypothetical protein